MQLREACDLQTTCHTFEPRWKKILCLDNSAAVERPIWRSDRTAVDKRVGFASRTFNTVTDLSPCPALGLHFSGRFFLRVSLCPNSLVRLDRLSNRLCRLVL